MEKNKSAADKNFDWYEECLGVSSSDVAPYDTTHISPSETPVARNFQVQNLEELLIQLAKKGVSIDNHIEENSHGLFAWVYDPEGNKIELWEPRVQQKDSLVNVPEPE